MARSQLWTVVLFCWCCFSLWVKIKNYIRWIGDILLLLCFSFKLSVLGGEQKKLRFERLNIFCSVLHIGRFKSLLTRWPCLSTRLWNASTLYKLRPYFAWKPTRHLTSPSFAQCRDQATTPDRISKTQFKEPRNAPWERLLLADFDGRVGFKFEKIMSHVCIEKGCLRIFQSIVFF